MERRLISIVVVDKEDPNYSMSFVVETLEQFVNDFWKEDDKEFREEKYVELFYALCNTHKKYVDIDDEFLYFIS